MSGQIVSLELNRWQPAADEATTRRVADALEAGQVLYLPGLAFRLRGEEQRFLDPRWSDGKAKNISHDPATGTLKGARGNRADLEDLQAMVARFHRQSLELVGALLPHYLPHLHGARASLRTMTVARRRTSWRKDDSRLHVDAFPSRPTHGERILRVFANVNPQGAERVWRVGEAFSQLAERFFPRLKAPLPGSAALLAWLGITKTRRTPYDHYMLHLHDAMKADLKYQREAPQERFGFAAGSVWLCFSDQTSHAAMSGQHMFEQTVHLAVPGLYDASRGPLAILEKLAGRALV